MFSDHGHHRDQMIDSNTGHDGLKQYMSKRSVLAFTIQMQVSQVFSKLRSCTTIMS